MMQTFKKPNTSQRTSLTYMNSSWTVFGIDLNGLVNEWNDKTAEITGYSKDEAMGEPLVSRFIVKKLKKSVQKVLDNALRGEETSNYELEFR
jgi:PAS domain S-box-containing protein